MEDEKKIVFNSSVQDINITNRLAHFQNSLFSKNYLDPNKKYAITPRQIYIDLNFKNPICPVNNAFPSLICCPAAHFRRKTKKIQENSDSYNSPTSSEHESAYYFLDSFRNLDSLSSFLDSQLTTTPSATSPDATNDESRIKLKYFYNIHKYYLNTSKKYTISELYNEWKSKEEIGIKTREKFQRGQYQDEELVLTTTFLKKTADSILFGQYPIEDNYTIRKEETNFLFFHFKFAENLGFDDKFSNAFTLDINGEKYYALWPLANLTQPVEIEVKLANQGLHFKTPSILQIKCNNIKSYPLNSSFTKTIGVTSVKENNNGENNNAFHHTFKGNAFFELENKLNETFEILITDENNSRLKLYEGIPTVVLVSAIEDNMENEVNVTCTSEITKFHPNNSPTNFASVLNTPMHMNREWKVALSSITFKNNFKFDSNFIFRFSYFQYNSKGKEVLKREKIQIDENIKTVEEIFYSFKSILKTHIPEEDSEEDDRYKDRKIGGVKLQNGFMAIDFRRATQMTLTPHLAMVLGVSNSPYESDTNDFTKESVKFNVGLDKTQNNELTPGGTFIATKPINFSFSLKQKFMFVEMNAIKDVPVGNGNAKILKIVPLSVESSGLYVTKDFDILDFHPLQHHHIYNIDFKLLSQSGSALKSHESEDYNITWLQLVFRKFPKNNEDEPALKRAKIY